MDVHDVLYPTDFSACAQQAFGYAAEMARRFEARLHLLHVVGLHRDLPYDPMFYVPAADEAYRRAETEATAALRELAASTAAADLTSVVAVRRAVDPGLEILAYAEENAVDLVVMGTRARRGTSRLLLGSRAEEVLRHSSCPVLTVRADDACATRDLPPREILVPFDFSGPSRLALRDAVSLARRCAATLRVLHVAEQLGADGGHGETESAERERSQRIRQLRSRLQDVVDYMGEGVQAQIEVRVGRPADQILDASQSPLVDLVVMATRGITGIKRLLFGSTAEEVVRLASAPVLVVKPEAPTLPAWSRGATEATRVEGAAAPAELAAAGSATRTSRR